MVDRPGGPHVLVGEIWQGVNRDAWSVEHKPDCEQTVNDNATNLVAVWIAENLANLEDRGVLISSASSPEGRIPASVIVDLEDTVHSARVVVWSNWQAQVNVGNLPRKEVIVDRYVADVRSEGLDLLFQQILDLFT